MSSGIIEDFQTRIENKEKLFIGEVDGTLNILFSEYKGFFDIYKMVYLISRDSKQKAARNH